MIDVVDLISAKFVSELARLGWPPLADLVNGDKGRILVGDFHQYGQFVPPRVIFRPIKSPFGPRITTLGANPNDPMQAPRRYTSEGKDAIANLGFLSEEFAFEVRCWGICPRDEDVEPRASELDYDFTRGLYTTLLETMQLLIPNAFKPESGTWFPVRHAPRVGREFVMNIAIGLPILRLGENPPAVTGWTPGEPAVVSPKADGTPEDVETQGTPFAPSIVAPLIEDGMSADGQVEPGCEDPEP